MNGLIIFCAKYLFLLVVLGVVIEWFILPRKQKAMFAFYVIGAGVIAYVLAKTASHLYYDPRPFVSEHVKPLIAHNSDNGFPSDHALLTMTLTAATFFFNKKLATFMLVLTVLVGVARILAKLHSPLDIGAGWVFGIVGAVVSYYLLTWYLGKKQVPAQLKHK